MYNMELRGKTILITGASRGIGKATAIRLAKDGANIVIAAKSVTEHPKLGGTIYSAAEEINKAGGQALPVACDIRDEEQILHTIQQAVSIFGGIDVVINNASAISLTNTEQTETKRFDLMLFTSTEKEICALLKSAAAGELIFPSNILKVPSVSDTIRCSTANFTDE